MAEDVVRWYRRLRCDLNLLRYRHAAAYDKDEQQEKSRRSKWSADILHRASPPYLGSLGSLIEAAGVIDPLKSSSSLLTEELADAIVHMDTSKPDHPVQQAGRRICQTIRLPYSPERVLECSFIAHKKVSTLQRGLAQHSRTIPLEGEVHPSAMVSWGALVNLYIQYGGNTIERSYAAEDEVDGIVGSVLMTGRWEHAWGRGGEIVDIPPWDHQSYDVVALKDDDDDDASSCGAFRFRLHDLSEVAKSKALSREPCRVAEWEVAELRYDGRDGKPCLLMHLPKWEEERGYTCAVDGCRMWNHLPPIQRQDMEATRSWSLWMAFGDCAVKSGSSGCCFVGLTRVRIGQLSDSQSDLLMDATVVEEAWTDSVIKLLLIASFLCHDDDDARVRFTRHLREAPGPREAQRRIVEEVGPEEWHRASLAVDGAEGDVLHPQMLDVEPFGGKVPPAVEISRKLRCLMAYMGHIVATNGRYTKRGRKKASKGRVKKKRSGSGSIASRKRKHFEMSRRTSEEP